jgi:hypothetical protein
MVLPGTPQYWVLNNFSFRSGCNLAAKIRAIHLYSVVNKVMGR